MDILLKIAEYTIEPIGRLLGLQLGYAFHCRTSLQNLRNQVAELKAARETLDSKVAEADRKGKNIEHDVQLWVEKETEIAAKTEKLLNDDNQAKLKCLHGFCPNLSVRYQLGKKSIELAEEVAEHHKKQKSFSQVSSGDRTKEVLAVTKQDYEAFQSRSSILKEILDHLKDSKTEIIGVCGIGGVGKTTLAKEIYNQVSKDKSIFDDVVILLDVIKEPDLEAIQKKILEKLDLDINENETKVRRARRLCARVDGKKVLVILDDVQEKIDLEDVGLPRKPTCKILVTCRTRDVLSHNKMSADKKFQLDLIGEEEGQNLFMKMVGDVEKHDPRWDIAVQIAKCCGGLPLLVVTVASTLKGKDIYVWKDALRQLEGFADEEFTETTYTERAYTTLEWSYKQLDENKLQPLFLLCGIMVRNNHIFLEDLFRYAMGLGLFHNLKVNEARDSMDTLLEQLKYGYCLVLDSDTKGFLRMHDLVCHVAKRIAHTKHGSSIELPYEDESKANPLKKCTKQVFLTCLKNISTFTQTPVPLEFPELELFVMQSDFNMMRLISESKPHYRAVVFSINFFEKMKKLKVLGLTNLYIESLPSSLQYLNTLQTLCLHGCWWPDRDSTRLGQLSSLEILSFNGSGVRELPKEIGELTHLRLLDLSDCSKLTVIPPAVISNLKRLEELKMRNSFNRWNVEGEGSNASLSELQKLSKLSALEIHIPNPNLLPANFFSSINSERPLETFDIVIGDDTDVFRIPATTMNILKLKLANQQVLSKIRKYDNRFVELDEGLKSLVRKCESLFIDETDGVIAHQWDTESLEKLKHLQLRNVKSNMVIQFPNLETLTVDGLEKLTSLLSFSMAKRLVRLIHLQIVNCENIQEILHLGEDGEESVDDLFPRLKLLHLGRLPNLARFCATSYIEFPALEKLILWGCDKLGAFIGEKVSMNSSEDTRFCKEIEQRLSKDEENYLDVKSETNVQYFLFDEKVRFPSLEILEIATMSKLKAIWHVQFAQESFKRLREVTVSSCDNLISLFLPGVTGRRKSRETLSVSRCKSLEVVFELPGGCSSVKGAHADTLTRHDQLKPFYLQNLESLSISDCERLKWILPAQVASEEDNYGPDAGVNEITFSCLQYLKLSNLPSLRDFCSGKCTVKSLTSENLHVFDCPIELDISADRVLITKKDR